MSRRRSRTLTKAQAGSQRAPMVGTSWTADQVAAILQRTISTAGGQAARPLPRLDPMVPFGPGVPLMPAPINPLRADSGRPEPRAFEYPVTWNLPGFGDRLIPFKVLRDAADLISLFRRCIEIRKAEVATLEWDVTISAKAVERAQRQDPNSARSDVEKAMRTRVDPHIGRLVEFWEEPDRRNGHDFIAWASKVLEEYFVLDAISIYPRLTRGADLYGFEVLDGTTIKPLLDDYGFRPMAPQAAYQQILWGFPRGEFTAEGEPDPDTGELPGAYPSDRLVYKVHNVRSFTPYGFSAVEQALNDGDLYMRRMAWLKAEYTDGVMPSGWLKTGEGQAEWSPQQLGEYERQLNDYYAGNTTARQRYRILPYGMEPQESKDLNERYRPDYDLHLIKLVASHFDTTIAELGFTETGGLGSTGWHEGQADVQDRKATQPTLRRLQALCTALMRRYLGAPPELEFRILGLEAEDEDAADEVANRRVSGARMTLNEDRDRTGLPRYNFAEADMPMLVTQRGIVFIEGASEEAPPGTMVGPAMAVSEGAVPGTPGAPPAGPGSPPQGQPGAPAPAATPGPQKGAQPAAPGKGAQADAVKAELVAYRRWLTARAGRTASRPFRFEHLTKVDAAGAGVDLTLAEFVGKAEAGDPGTAPKVRHWPGWERDLAVAEHWATRLQSGMTGVVSATKLVTEAAAAHRAGDGRDGVARAIAHHDFAKAIRPALKGLWTDGYVVGTLASRAVLAHHGLVVKAEQAPVATVTLGVDWGGWTPGDELAARQILEREHALDALLALVDDGDVVSDAIAVNRMDRLAAALIQGLERGDSPAAIARVIEPILGDAKWAHLVALTETTRAVSSATLLRYARNGVEAKEWMTALDQRVCPQCLGNEEAGPIGLDTAFPDGTSAPPAHPLCRCSIAPAFLSLDEAIADGVVGDLSGLANLAPLVVGEEQLAAVATQAAEDLLAGEEEGDALTTVREASTPPPVHELPPPPVAEDPVLLARARTAEFAETSKVAAALTETEELVANQASDRALLHRLDAHRRLGVPDSVIDPLVAAAQSGDRAEVGRLIDQIGAEHNFSRITRAGDTVNFDRRLHEPIGRSIEPGTRVHVVRPGYHVDYPDERVLVSRAVVQDRGPELVDTRAPDVRAAQERQAEIDVVKKSADAAGEVHELLGVDAEPAVIRERLTALGRRTGLDLSALAAAADDPAALAAAADALADRAGLVRLGSAGDITEYDPLTHQAIGGGIQRGEQVEVVRPGYTATLRSGEQVRVAKIRVETYDGPPELPIPPGTGPLPNRQVRTFPEILAQAQTRTELNQARAEVMRAIDGEYGSAGLRAVTEEVQIDSLAREISFRGTVHDADGIDVGVFSRYLSTDYRTGERFVQHALLELSTRAQGSGFAEAFNRNLFDWYRRSGVDYVGVHANIDVGGYTWATQGFDFANEEAASDFLGKAEAKLDRALNGQSVLYGAPDRPTVEQLQELQAYLEDLRAGKMATSAPDIARFGRQPGQGGRAAMWPGKWLMMGLDWFGRLDL